MQLHPHEFIRRFLIHVLPKGFHRIRHYGLFAHSQPRREHRESPRNSSTSPRLPPTRKSSRILLPTPPRVLPCPCPRCGGPHDRDRDLRARLRAEVAPDADQDRHIMSQNAREPRTFSFRCAGPTPAAIPFDPITAINVPSAR